MMRLNKIECPILVLLCIFCFKREPFRFSFYFTAAGVNCRVAAVKLLPVLHQNADYILNSFGIIEPILIALKSAAC